MSSTGPARPDLSRREMECPSCGKKSFLVELTAEDIQRVRPPTVGMVCEGCREKYRSAARLEIRYSTRTALRDLALVVLVGVSLLLLVIDALSTRLAVSVVPSNVSFFVTAATSLTGLRMMYSELRGRYGFTHSLS